MINITAPEPPIRKLDHFRLSSDRWHLEPRSQQFAADRSGRDDL